MKRLLGVWAAGVVVATTAWSQSPPLTFSGNAYDFVVLVAQNRQLAVAIDPDALADLAKTNVEIDRGSTQSGAELLATRLAAAGFVLKPVELGAGTTVTYVTTPSGWAYAEAMGQLKRGQVPAAYATLKSVTGETPMARHCAAFVKACDAIAQRNQMLNRLEPDIRQRIENFNHSVKDLELAKMAAGSSMGSGSTISGFAANRHQQALAEGKKAWETLDQFAKGMLDANQPARDCLTEARAWGLQTEARFLYEQLVDSGLRLRRLLALMKKAGLAESEEDYEAVPDLIKELRTKYAEATAEADRRAAAAAKLVTTQPETVEEEFVRAYDADRACPLARVGYGYTQVRRNARSIQTVFSSIRPVTERGDALEKEWSDREKRGLLLALFDYRQQTIPAAVVPRTKTGSTRGLVVADGKGELFPVSVRVETIRQSAAESVRSNFWGSLLVQKIEEQRLPVSFGDYGAKDPFMLLAATEAYKWLRSVDGTFQGSTGLKVEFQELFGGKAGDSAGVTIATSGYSEVRRVAVRQDVAMTGSIRADGGVKAVGAVPLKLAGAVAATGIEVAVVPRENEPELMTLSVEQLCRVAVIVADDMATYLKYACEPPEEKDNGKNATAQREAWQALKRLRQGQVRLLLGDWKGAVEPLAAVAGHREVYNARRLLDLIQARLMTEGNIAAAADVKKQIQAAQRSAVLLAGANQYEVPIKRDQVAFRDVPEPEPPVQPKVTPQPPEPAVQPEPAGPLAPLLTGIGKQIAWDALPFPKNSDWPGPKGKRAQLDHGELILRGQPVRTRQVFTAPTSLQYEQVLNAPLANDGCLSVTFMPEDAPGDMNPPANTVTVQIGYQKPDGSGAHVTVYQGRRSERLSRQPFVYKAAKVYTVRIDAQRDSIRVSIDGTPYSTSKFELPAKFYILVSPWQPDNTWHVRNILIR
jgi:hypothetical protein